jgi:geranylgeranyl diphosphate synthase type II
MTAVSPRQCERHYDLLRRAVDRRVAALSGAWRSPVLAEGCRYVLAGGGKRVRPVLLLLSCEAVGGRHAAALPAAAAVEALHNFTLVHDDIMDRAATRRGRPTVHTRWDTNTALLVGDVLLGLAYRALPGREATDRLVRVFTRGLLEVCEGQALDMEYERRARVSTREYFLMIEKKTAWLLATAAELGGILGGGTPRRLAALRTFGMHLGRAFQVQDDLLDVLGEEETFGKAIGGDILEGKRTYLLLRALERAQGADRSVLGLVFRRRPPTGRAARRRFVHDVREIYLRTGAAQDARRHVQRETGRAVQALGLLPETRARAVLHWLAHHLLTRTV